MSEREWPELGWCHNCETFQLFADAAWHLSQYGGGLLPHCVACDEDWRFGVFPQEDVIVQQVRGRPGWVQVWSCFRWHCENRHSFYPGDCDCATVTRRGLATVKTRCRDCDLATEFRQLEVRPRREQWEADKYFVCEHWRDHELAAARAVGNESGRSSSGPVLANVAGWR